MLPTAPVWPGIKAKPDSKVSLLGYVPAYS